MARTRRERARLPQRHGWRECPRMQNGVTRRGRKKAKKRAHSPQGNGPPCTRNSNKGPKKGGEGKKKARKNSGRRLAKRHITNYGENAPVVPFPPEPYTPSSQSPIAAKSPPPSLPPSRLTQLCPSAPSA
jgi:hypothetical protein